MATFIFIGLLAIIAYELFIFIKYPPGIWPNAGNTVKRQVSEETAEEDCAIIGHSTFNMSDQLRRMEVRQTEEERKSAVVRGEMTEDGKEIATPVSIEDCQLEDKKQIVPVPDEELDDMFAEPDVPTATGDPLDDIDLAFNTARQKDPDEQDEQKAAAVLNCLKGTELLDMVAGLWPEIGENVERIIEKYYGEKSDNPKTKRQEFTMPDRFEDFNVSFLV